MDIPFQFNASQYSPSFASGGGNSLPVGKHPVYLNSAEFKTTQANDGSQMLVLTAECFDGPAKGQSQDIRLNVQNKSATASKIAYQQLSAICVVCGQPQGIMQATSEIFNKPFIIEIAPQKGEEAQKKGYTEPVNVYFMDGRDALGNAPKPGGVAPGAPPAGAFAPQGQQPQQQQPQGQQQGQGGFAPPAGAFQPPQQGQQPQFQPQQQSGAFQPPGGGGGFAPPGAGGFAPPGAAPFGGMPGGQQMPAPPGGAQQPWNPGGPR